MLFERKRQTVEKEIKVKILTVSDGVAHGLRENKSSAALAERVATEGWKLEEASVTGNIDGGAGPPKTPAAFRKKNSKKKSSKRRLIAN